MATWLLDLDGVVWLSEDPIPGSAEAIARLRADHRVVFLTNNSSGRVRDNVERLAAAGVDASVGNVGDALDNALAESVIGLFKTELIRRRGPWRTVEHVEAATLHWVDWFNRHRLLEVNGDLPPIELEQAYYRQTTSLDQAG